MIDTRSRLSAWDDPDEVNVGPVERGASITLGAALVAFAVAQRRPVAAVLLGSLGAYLGLRGVTGRCALYEAADYSTVDPGDDERLAGGPLVDRSVEGAVTIARPPGEVYAFWRDLANLPRVLRHVRRVEPVDDTRWRWFGEGPGGLPLEWDAQVLVDRPGELIAWSSEPGGDVFHVGSARFAPAPGDRGTEVRVEIEFEPPSGAVHGVMARVFGHEPHLELDEDLRRLKQLLEAGEVATADGQPHGPTRPGGEAMFRATRAALEARG
jgi:uncharacterized membrane protein